MLPRVVPDDDSGVAGPTRASPARRPRVPRTGQTGESRASRVPRSIPRNGAGNPPPRPRDCTTPSHPRCNGSLHSATEGRSDGPQRPRAARATAAHGGTSSPISGSRRDTSPGASRPPRWTGLRRLSRSVPRHLWPRPSRLTVWRSGFAVIVKGNAGNRTRRPYGPGDTGLATREIGGPARRIPAG